MMPLAMLLPPGSLRTSGGTMLSRCAPAFWRPIQRDVCAEPSWLRKVIHESLVRTFWPTPRLGTTMTLRTGSYEQLSAEYTDPYTFTLLEIGVKAPSVAGVIGRPRRCPTEYGPGAGGAPCCASAVPIAIPDSSVIAAVITTLRCVICVSLFL